MCRGRTFPLTLVILIGLFGAARAQADYFATAIQGNLYGKRRTVISVTSHAGPDSVIDGISLVGTGPDAREAAEQAIARLDQWVVQRGYLERRRFEEGSATHASVLAEGVNRGVTSVVGIVGDASWDDIEFVLRADTRGDGEAALLPLEAAGHLRILPPKDSPVPPEAYLDGMVELKRYYKGREVDPQVMELGIAWGELSGVLSRGKATRVNRSPEIERLFLPPQFFSRPAPVYEYVIRCDRAAARIYARMGFVPIPEERIQREKPLAPGEVATDVYLSLPRSAVVEMARRFLASDRRPESHDSELSVALSSPAACNTLYGSLVGNPQLVRYTPMQVQLSRMRLAR